MTHEEKTRIIAEFDGCEFHNDDEFYEHGYFLKDTSMVPLEINELEYDLSYDWLMPVWHKFRDLRFRSINDQFTHSHYKESIIKEIANGNEETLFNALAEAIEWYNTTKK